MEINKVENLSECIKQLEKFGRHLPLSEIFINHMKLVMEMHLTEYTFYSVEESGTYRNIPPAIISVCEDRIKPEYQLIFHDKDTGLVKDALTTLVDWTKTNKFFPLPVCQIPVLSDIVSVNGATITTDIRFYHFVMRNMDDLPELKLEDDICVRSLTEDDAPIIDSHWNTRDEDSEMIIRRNIERCQGYGVYYADRLVSWMVLRGHGSMSYLNTIPEARRRGYSLTVVNKLSRHIRSIGLTPIADVVVGNIPSENLFGHKLGFQQTFATTSLIIAPR